MVASGQHTGRTDIPLTDRGRVLAKATAGLGGRYLLGRPPALVLTSPRARAQVTAELAGLHVDRIDDRLVEWDYGEYEGLTTERDPRDQPGWTVWDPRAPDGETAGQVTQRADDLLADARRAADGDVVLVGHGHFSRVLVGRWLGLPVVDGVQFAMDAAAWAVLGRRAGASAASTRSTAVPRR